MSDYYSKEKGCLRYITDILDDCDGCNSIESLKELIQETRKIAIRGITEGENFDIKDLTTK